MRILFVVNDDWFFISHRLPIALKAVELGYEVHLATSQDDQKDYLESLGLKHHCFAVNKAGSNPFEEIKTIYSLYKLFKMVQPDVVHNITIKPVLYGGVAARFAGIKKVVSAISGMGIIFIQTGRVAAIKRFIVGLLYKVAIGHNNSIVITQNPDDAKAIKNLANLNPEIMRLIKGSGVDINLFQPTPIPETDSFKITLIARMLEDKGVYEFYQAAKLLKPNYPNCEFILAGDLHHNPSSLTTKQLTDWNEEGVVKWVGHQTDVRQIIAESHLIVLPSYREGLPKVLLEAAAMARPVVTTDVPGCRDAIIDKQTGLLAEVKNSESLATAIEQFLINPAMSENFGNAGRELVEREFSIDKVVQQHMDIYSTSIGSKA